MDGIHCLNPIKEQVEKHLLQLDPIARHQRQILLQVGLHRDLSLGGLASQQTKNFADHLVQVEPRFLNRRALEECPDAPHYFAGLLAVAYDALRRLVGPLHIGRLRGKESDTSMAARYHLSLIHI